MLNGLDLFSGIGGLAVALGQYVRPIAYCEIDTYCQGVLLSRMHDGSIARSPIWDDVRTLCGQWIGGDIDIIYGGFPCQDISVAGHGKGLAGERSGLYWQIHRLAKEIQPPFIFLENVPAILCRGGSTVVESITAMGYDCRWCVISAASVGALHRRERWFLLAHSKRDGRRPDATRHELQSAKCVCDDNSLPSEQTDSCAIPEQNEGRAWGGHTGQYWPFESRTDWQETCARVYRVSDAIPFRVDRIKSLGNSVVPVQAQTAFEVLMGLDRVGF